jgi:ATP-binding cassette subfamily C protein CydCD
VSDGQEATTRPGPLDPRVLALSPSLRRHLVVASVAAIVVAVAVLAQAEVLANVIVELVDGDRTGVPVALAGLAGVAVLRALAAGVTDRSATAAVVATRRDVQRAVLHQVRDLSADQRNHLGPSRVASLLTSATDAVEPWIRSYAPGLPLAVVVPLAAGLRILGADVTSALILAVVVPLVPLFMVLIGRATERRAQSQWEALSRLAARFLDVLSGLPTLRLFGRADAQVQRVREVTDRYRTVTMRTLRVAFLSALVLELLASLSVALVAVALGGRLVHGQIGLQTALVVLLLAPECLLPIRRVAAAFHAAAAGVDAAAEVHEALALPTRPNGTSQPTHHGRLEATGVAVVDPHRGPRLAPTDLATAPGTLVAVTGPSGAGKSTLLDVLRGALAPTVGTVTLDGTALGTLDPDARARSVRWVPQRSQPLGERVDRSVALGHPSGTATDAAVARALESFGLTTLAALPPADASGGERRRIALARAYVGVLLGTVDVWLVDEPTAQLDGDAARAVRAALTDACRRGVAVVAATHDPVLVAEADDTVALLAPASVGAEGDQATAAPSVVPPARTEQAPVPDPVSGWAAEVDLDPGPTDLGAVRWLLGTARGQRRRLLGAAALGVLTDACAVALTATAAWLIVRASELPSFADLAIAAVGVRTFALGKGVLRYAERLSSHDATLRLLADLRAVVIARLARLAPTGLPKGARGDLLARLVDDIDRMQDLFLRVLGPVTSALLVGIAAAAGAALIDPAGGAVLLATVVLLGVALPLVAHRAARARGRRAAGLRGAIATDAVDLAEHAEELLAAAATEPWLERLHDATLQLDAVDRRQGRASAAIAAATAAAPAVAVAAMVATLGGVGDVTGPALGVLVLLPLAVVELVAPLAPAGEALARVEASATRVLALLRRPDPVIEPEQPAPAPAGADLAFDDVAVGWPGGQVQVTGVDLAVAEGERVVITGPSGSGKSTLAALAVAFLAPRSGRYEVGGTDAAQLGGDRVRQHVSWCQQDPWFADSTVADNLRVARPEATDAELWAALESAHLDTWVRSLPDGLETRLERDASAMSGGQRQRLALARALLGGQRALVLDEPTSHLDERTAEAVLTDLLHATRDRAVVVIAHGALAPESTATWELRTHGTGPSTWHRRR